jgi:hypothetical protein
MPSNKAKAAQPEVFPGDIPGTEPEEVALLDSDTPTVDLKTADQVTEPLTDQELAERMALQAAVRARKHAQPGQSSPYNMRPSPARIHTVGEPPGLAQWNADWQATLDHLDKGDALRDQLDKAIRSHRASESLSRPRSAQSTGPRWDARSPKTG